MCMANISGSGTHWPFRERRKSTSRRVWLGRCSSPERWIIAQRLMNGAFLTVHPFQLRRPELDRAPFRLAVSFRRDGRPVSSTLGGEPRASLTSGGRAVAEGGDLG